MIHKTTERGQALILIALAAIGLFAFSALAIDGTRTFSNKRHAQNAADTAVLAGALKYIRTGSLTAAEQAARDRATSNGYTNDTVTSGPNTKVYFDLCSTATPACTGLPSGANAAEYMRVRIVSTIPTTFGRVLGRQTMTSAAEAIARVQGSSSSSSGSLFQGAAMVATKGGDYNQCFLVNGGADLYTHGSGIYVNCSGSQAIFLNGGSTVDMDAMGEVAGCYAYNGGAVFDPIHCQNGPSLTFNADSFKDVPTMPTPPTCSSAGSKSGGTLSPGYFNGNVTIDQDTTMQPGVYCFNGGININGQNHLNGPTGKIQMVMGNNDFNLGTVDFNFNDLEVYSVNGTFRANGNGVLNANRLRFYSSGSGNFQINGQGGATSNNAYIYLKGGEITWNGNSTLNLHAAPQNDPEGVGGLLVYMPWSNTTPIKYNGGSNIHLTGTALMPHAPVTFNGGVNFELHSQIIAYEYIVNGGGAVDIYYTASENYNPPVAANPTIELTK